ncbi:MAG TPA: V4R domain-containing protein, partial [Candidatus Hodarchaeales archaeon]|nr:V4R domain-containing protein [Candidatus Hodarchaeales archaeon]
RLNGRVHLKMIDVETALLQIEESAISSGLSFEIGGALMFDVDKEKAVLCDFTAGFIQGRLEKLLDEPVRVKETNCISLGVSMCEFTIELD